MQNEPIGGSGKTPIEPAFAAALTFVDHLQKLTDLAKDYSPVSSNAAPNPSLGLEYAGAFLAWLDLSYLLTQEVRVSARLIHQGSPVIRLSPQSDAAESVIAAVERDLGGGYLLTSQTAALPSSRSGARTAAPARSGRLRHSVARGRFGIAPEPPVACVGHPMRPAPATANDRRNGPLLAVRRRLPKIAGDL